MPLNILSATARRKQRIHPTCTHSGHWNVRGFKLQQGRLSTAWEKASWWQRQYMTGRQERHYLSFLGPVKLSSAWREADSICFQSTPSALLVLIPPESACLWEGGLSSPVHRMSISISLEIPDLVTPRRKILFPAVHSRPVGQDVRGRLLD